MNDLTKYTLDGVLVLSYGGCAFSAVMAVLAEMHEFSERINTQERLDQIVQEEAAKLGIKKPVRAKLRKSMTGYIKKEGDGYDLNVGGCLATHHVVRHELWHAYRDLDSVKGHKCMDLLKYYLVREPRAMLYGALEIKL